MLKKRILIVEDDKDIARLLQYNLDKAGFDCFMVMTGEEALAALARRPADLVMLDVMLPGGMDGLEICRRIKQDSALKAVPVMMLTAKGEEVDRVVGLELGAEDYVVKPFSVREVVLRVKTLLRRTVSAGDAAGQPRLEAGTLVIDQDRHRVTVDGKEIVLTAMEFKLLLTLMERRGRVQGREKLLNDVWGMNADVFTRTIDTHVRRLRSKLGKAGDRIQTVVGVGYRFKEDDNET
ncbi:MAG: response regulator transcription factor [Candidatus Omnitrophica bacterium]|nr:response regulator transcription factor [Candidatus Omnitrophota bacterium]